MPRPRGHCRCPSSQWLSGRAFLVIGLVLWAFGPPSSVLTPILSACGSHAPRFLRGRPRLYLVSVNVYPKVSNAHFRLSYVHSKSSDGARGRQPIHYQGPSQRRTGICECKKLGQRANKYSEKFGRQQKKQYLCTAFCGSGLWSGRHGCKLFNNYHNFTNR